MNSRRRAGLLLLFTISVLPSYATGCRVGSPGNADLDAFDRGDLADVGPAPDRGPDTPAPRVCGGRGEVGGVCAAAECFDRAQCQEEVLGERPSVRRDAAGPGRPYPVAVYPDGICEVWCSTLRAGTESGCDECTTCVPRRVVPGRPLDVEIAGTCVLPCAQDIDGRGGCRAGYGCDRAHLGCVPACTRTDGTDTCQYTFEDRDSDPTTYETIVDEGVDYPSSCNLITGLCETTGRAGASAGDDCTTALDCESDGECVRSAPTAPPSTLSDGYCVRHGCNETDLRCAAGDVCSLLAFDRPGGTCMQGCSVGGETDDSQRRGAEGGHPGCDRGEACFWDGVHGTMHALNGGCFPGNYNDVSTYNVGAECQSDSECWSPFGFGRCLFADGELHDRTGRGICSVRGCGETLTGERGLAVSGGVVPVARPEDLCRNARAGGNDVCVALDDREPACLAGCTTAEDCPSGYACPDLSDDPMRPLRLCWPACTMDDDCRAGARCRGPSATPCNADVDVCTCSGTSATSDAGVEDAGVSRAELDATAVPDAP